MAEADAGSQQLLEKLLDVEKDVEGKMRDSASSVQNQLSNLDADNKNNTQVLVSLQETINIQAEQARQVEAERASSDAKLKQGLEDKVAANASAIADLRNEVD